MAKSASKSTPQTRKRRATAATRKTALKSTTAVPKYPLAPAAEIAPAAPVRLPSAWKLFRASMRRLWANRKLFIGISAIYAALSLVLVQSLTGILNVGSLKSLLDSGGGRLVNGAVTFAWLFGGNGTSQDVATTVYEILLLIVVSLAVIWTLRQVAVGRHIRIRDSFYNGMYPLVPVILVSVVGLLQFLPTLIGFGVYNVVVAYGLVQPVVLRLLLLLPALAVALWSLYMITSTILAIYIATIPEMGPQAALQSARQLVNGRRWMILRKLLFLPLVIVVVGSAVLTVAVLSVPLAAPWILFIMSIICVPVVHSYIYHLYRELLA